MDQAGRLPNGNVIILMTDREWESVKEVFTNYGNDIGEDTMQSIADACKSIGLFKERIKIIVTAIEAGVTK